MSGKAWTSRELQRGYTESKVAESPGWPALLTQRAPTLIKLSPPEPLSQFAACALKQDYEQKFNHGMTE